VSRRKVADKIADMFIGFMKQDVNPNRAGYVYKTVNTVDGMKYIGSKLAPKGHTGTYFNENYYGSGSDLKKAIDQYGIGNFINVKEIDTRTINGLKKAEQGLLNRVDAKQDPTYYNNHNHYSGGGNRTPEANKKISDSLIGNQRAKGNKLSEETKRKISAGGKGNTNSKGRKLSEETKRKIRESMKGNKNSQGIKRSKETKRKISETLKKNKGLL